MHIHSGDFTFLPFIDNADVPSHNIYMNIGIRDDLKLYSTSKLIQSDGNETDQETFKQTIRIKSKIPGDIPQTSEAPKQSTEKSTMAKSGNSKGEITATKVRTRQTQRGRYREAKSFSNLFAAHDTLQEIMYLQIDDLTIKDVFLSSILKWTFSKDDKGQPKTPSKDMFDYFFYIKCDQESLQRDIHSAIRSNLYRDVPALQGLAKQTLMNENYKCLLVIDVPEELNLELNVALRAKFCSIFPNATIMMISPFIDMKNIEEKLDEHARVVHVYKKDQHDLSEMIKEYMKSKSKSADNVLNQIANDNVNDTRWKRFSNDPFLISLLLFSHHTPSGDESIIQFMTNTLNQLLRNGIKNGALSVNSTKQFLVDTKRNETLQRIIDQYETVSQCLPILLTLGLIAFQNLTGEHTIKEPSNKREKYHRRDVISVGVKVGLLRKTASESSIAFLHDIFQDWFAALWTVEREMFKEFVDASLTSLQHLPSHAQYLTFLAGLDLKLGPIIAQHIADLCDKDNRILEYRHTLGVSPFVSEMNNIWKGIWEETSLTNGDCQDQYSTLVLSDVVQAYENLDHLPPAKKEAIISFYLDDVTKERITYSRLEALVTFLQQCPNIQKLALTCQAVEIIKKSGTTDLLPSLHVLHVQGHPPYNSLPVDWLVLQNVTSLSLCRITFSSDEDKRRVECWIESLQGMKELRLEDIDSAKKLRVRVKSHLKALTLKYVSLEEIYIQIVSSLESIVIYSLKCSDREVLKIISYIQETTIIKECDIVFPDTVIQMIHCKFLRHLRLTSFYSNSIHLTRISETLPHLTVCNLNRITLDDSVCRALETALHSASSLEVLEIRNINTEWMSVDMSNSTKLRSLTIRQCPLVHLLFCTNSLKILDMSGKVFHTKQVLTTESKSVHSSDKDVGCMTIKDKHVRLDISNSCKLNVLQLTFVPFKISDIQINVDQLETITMRIMELDSVACAQLDNIIKRARKVKYCSLDFKTSGRIPRVNLLNCVYLQSLDTRNITNISVCPWVIRKLKLSEISICTMYNKDHVGGISELLDLALFSKLECICLDDVKLDDSGLLLTSFNVLVHTVELLDVRMSLRGWFTFIQSLLNVEGRICVDIKALDADIPDEILNIIMSSVMFRISKMDLRVRRYKRVRFEKLECPDWRRHRHGYSTERMLPRVVKPFKHHDPIVSSSEGMITLMTFQGEIIKQVAFFKKEKQWVNSRRRNFCLPFSILHLCMKFEDCRLKTVRVIA